jgi:hypothetical protein
MSGEISVRRGPPAWLGAIANVVEPSGGSGLVAIRSTLASGGASAVSPRTNASMVAGSPSTSANTPSTSLPTRPDRPRPVASE